MTDCDCVPGHRCDCWDWRADRPPEPPTLDAIRALIEHRIELYVLAAEKLGQDPESAMAVIIEDWDPYLARAAAALGASPPPPDLSELRALSEAATPGPWRVMDGRYVYAGVDDFITGPITRNAEFVAAAVNYVRAALASQPPSTPRETTP